MRDPIRKKAVKQEAARLCEEVLSVNLADDGSSTLLSPVRNGALARLRLSPSGLGQFDRDDGWAQDILDNFHRDMRARTGKDFGAQALMLVRDFEGITDTGPIAYDPITVIGNVDRTDAEKLFIDEGYADRGYGQGKIISVGRVGLFSYGVSDG